MKKIKFIFCSLLMISFQTLAYGNEKKYVNDLANDFMKKNSIPGLSVAVLNQEHISIYNYGYANEKQKIKTTSQTLYRINSFTKTITATLAGLAQVEGKLKLSDPLTLYMPEVSQNPVFSFMRIDYLLAHIASLPSVFDPSPKNFSDFISFLKTFKPPYPIGTQYKYSNYSIGAVGYVLQNIYHQTYEEILNTKLIKPLKLKSTYLTIPPSKEKFQALGHDGEKTVLIPNQVPVLFAAADIKSTIADMAKYLQAQMDIKKALNNNLKKGLALVHNTKFCFENINLCQQMAWQQHAIEDLAKTKSDTLGDYHVAKEGEDPLFGKVTFVDKTGGGFGMSSYMVYMASAKIGVVVLINKQIDDEKIEFARKILQHISPIRGDFDHAQSRQ